MINQVQKNKLINSIYRTEPQRSSLFKAEVSNKFITVSKYTKPIILNKRSPNKKEKLPKKFDFDMYIIKRAIYQRIKKNRAIKKIQDMVESNFTKKSIFLTLTFKDNIQLDEGVKKWNLFCKKLKRKYPDFQYVAVPEYQERGAIHFHAILNIPFIQSDYLNSYWPYGFWYTTKVYSTTGLSAYLVKYLVKSFDDYRFYAQRTFYVSRGLKRAKIYYFDLAEKIFKYCHRKYIPIFVRVIDSEYNGDIFRYKYKLPKKINVEKFLK